MPPEGISKETFAIANIVIYLAICVGVAFNRNRRVHTRIMWSCFAADILMVLIIELSRKALKQAGETALHMSERPLLAFHIFVSVMTLVFWFVQLRGGPRLIRMLDTPGTDPAMLSNARGKHRLFARVFLAFRTSNLITSFFV